MRVATFPWRARSVAVAAFLLGLVIALPGCTLTTDEQPPIGGPSETGVSVQLTALPDVVNADGVSQAVVELVLRDQNGAPIAGKAVEFVFNGDGQLFPSADSTFVGPQQSSIVMATDASGVTRVVWVAGFTIQTVTISVRAFGIDAARAFFSSIEIIQR